MMGDTLDAMTAPELRAALACVLEQIGEPVTIAPEQLEAAILDGRRVAVYAERVEYPVAGPVRMWVEPHPDDQPDPDQPDRSAAGGNDSLEARLQVVRGKRTPEPCGVPECRLCTPHAPPSART